MRKSSISPAVVQTLFDSASNAADKGQAQWLTPVEWARALALPLNGFRPVIADLTAGNGQLLAGAGKRSDLLGCDLEPCAQSPATAKHFVPADITRFYQLLRAVNWQCDTFVLNPPWDLHWYRNRLAGLVESECAAVREAFAAHDGRTSRETIDSTVATLCIALDRCSSFGEGFLIANESTLQRLILGENAPHRALAGHIWANFAIAGNICMAGRKDQQTGVIWFARGHHRGPLVNERLSPDDVQPGDQDLLGLVTRACTRLERDRLRFRTGPWAASYLHTQSTRELWQAAREESLRTANMQTANMATMSGQYHIWFDPQAGVICTHLNSFETASGRVDKAHAAALHALNGCQPIQLVVQRSQRQALLDAVKRSDGTSPVWRVDPALPKVVESAIAEYNRVRAPLYPLPKIQRLGYLDEQDEILCCQHLAGPSGAVFLPGRRYSIRSATVATRRLGTKINNIGLPDEVEWNGQELAFFITDQSGVERCFMEGRLREANVTINLSRGRSRRHNERDGRTDSQVIDFTLQELVTHFDIPEVPDVASCFPEQYAAHRQSLLTIAKQVGIRPHSGPDAVSRFEFKGFQLEDYARAALHDGIILGHDTGLGKTIAMFIWPLLKCTHCVRATTPEAVGAIRPAKPVLLVVPGDGHDQTDDESMKHFKTKAVRLDSQAKFRQLARPDPRTGQLMLEPHFYLTSYTQLTGNGVADFPPLDRANPERTLALLNLTETDAVDWWNRRGQLYQSHYERLKVTLDTPLPEIESAFTRIRRVSDQVVVNLAYESLCVLRLLTPDGLRSEWPRWPSHSDQRRFIRAELAITRHREFSAGIGETRNGFKCVYSPSLADLCQHCFAACVIDEGTKIKGDDTIIGNGVRQINAPYRLVLTATPIKNRFPDLFHLAHYVTGGHAGPTPRFPYGKVDKQQFAEEFLVSERNLTKEQNAREKRRFVKFTPQICNVHRAWKLLAPIILRRRKEDCGEDIVKKTRHVVRVPMGLYQAAAYQFHLQAKYLDVNGRKAVGAQLQALRIAAANPASELLIRPEKDVTPGQPRSRYSYIPKVATTLELIRQVMERGEQVLVGSAFQDGLDTLSARLHEAGVKHLVMDGRITQKRRGELARVFKQGCPRAVREGLTTRHSPYPVILAGVECMAELHSFHLCNNVILTAYSWAFDKFEQFINRAHRLNSPWPVNVWSIICDGSIDRKLEAGIHEKKDAAELVLDGHLLGETPEEANLHELLRTAQREFQAVKTIDENLLDESWPNLRSAISQAGVQWNYAAKTATVPNCLIPKVSPQIPSSFSAKKTLPLWRQRFR